MKHNRLHDQEKCQGFDDTEDSKRAQAAEQESEKTFKKTTRPCPSCNSRIEQAEGCAHMICEWNDCQRCSGIQLSGLTWLLIGACGQHFCFECLGKYVILGKEMIFPRPSVTRLQHEFKLPFITMPLHRHWCSQRGGASLGTLHGHHLTTAFSDAAIVVAPGTMDEESRRGLYGALLADITPLRHPRELAEVARNLDHALQFAWEEKGRKAVAAESRLNPKAPAFEPRASGGRRMGSTQLVPFRQDTRSSHDGHYRATLGQHSKRIGSLIESIEQAIVFLQREIAVHRQRIARLEIGGP